MEVQGERKDEDRSPSYEGGYLYSDICRTWDRTGHIAAFHVLPKKQKGDAEPTMQYTAGVYTSSVMMGSQSADIQVIVDENRIQSITFAQSG